MADAPEPQGTPAQAQQVEQEPADEAGVGPPFGPAFFLGQLRAFILDRCPAPEAGLPLVEIHLFDGETLDLCHVVGVASPWVALAVNERVRGSPAPRMRTEIVPYACIVRVTVRTALAETSRVGFDVAHVPPRVEGTRGQEVTPKTALRAAGQSRDASPDVERGAGGHGRR
jgi:hypothetical protein